MEKFREKRESESERQEREQKALEGRLESLVDKTVTSYKVEQHGSLISIGFDDGTTMKFGSWDAFNDVPYPEGVEVNPPKKESEKPEKDSLDKP